MDKRNIKNTELENFHEKKNREIKRKGTKKREILKEINRKRCQNNKVMPREGKKNTG